MEQHLRDRLMGMMAVEKGLIKEKDLTKCLNIAEFSEGKTMKQVMVEQGILTQYKADKLERILERQSNPESARLPQEPSTEKFGVLCVEKGVCDQGAIDGALAEQKEFASHGMNIPLGQILMSQGQMTSEDVTLIIERQGRRRLECDNADCKKAFNVQGYDEDKFYTCPKCDADLIPCAIEGMERGKLQEKLESLRAKKKAQEEAAAKKKAAAAAAAKKKAAAPSADDDDDDPFDIDIDFDAIDFDEDEDDDDDDGGDEDDEFGDLMILEL